MTPILIVGGGFAGLWIAHSFTRHAPGKKALIVDKGPQEWGDYEAGLPPVTVDKWLVDLVYYFDGLCGRHFTENMLAKSTCGMKEYGEMAANFFVNRTES